MGLSRVLRVVDVVDVDDVVGVVVFDWARRRLAQAMEVGRSTDKVSYYA